MGIFSFFASLFGYVLNFLYNLINNYGLAIILFTILIKIIMLPISIKQQKTMKKSTKLQEKMKVLQFKYKNDQEKMNQEMMKLYKEENMSPFSGCLTGIAQFILLISIFYVVRCPLTYMKKVDKPTIDNYITTMKEEGKITKDNYPEIDVIREKGKEDPNVYINMGFLGLDLSQVPQQNLTDYKVWIIPILYILSSFVSIKLTTAMQNKKKKKDEIIDVTDTKNKDKQKEENNEMDTVMQANKTMSWMMPILSISIAIIAPLGLALYWLISNILMIGERLVLDKILKTEEED